MSNKNHPPDPNVEKSKVRDARLSRDRNGAPLGVAIFLSTKELDSMGVDVKVADRVSIEIDGEKIKIRSAGNENQGGERQTGG